MTTPLWEPPAELVERATLTRFMRAHGFADYASLWQWSVDDLDGFWGAIWDFFGVGEPSLTAATLLRRAPGAARRRYRRRPMPPPSIRPA